MNAYARKCTDPDTDALCFFLSVLCEARIHILEKYIDPDQMLENYPDSHVQRVFKCIHSGNKKWKRKFVIIASINYYADAFSSLILMFRNTGTC